MIFLSINFKCKYCGSENNFNPEDTEVSLSENNSINKSKTFFPKCNNCGKKNPVEVK